LLFTRARARAGTKAKEPRPTTGCHLVFDDSFIPRHARWPPAARLASGRSNPTRTVAETTTTRRRRESKLKTTRRAGARGASHARLCSVVSGSRLRPSRSRYPSGIDGRATSSHHVTPARAETDPPTGARARRDERSSSVVLLLNELSVAASARPAHPAGALCERDTVRVRSVAHRRFGLLMLRVSFCLQSRRYRGPAPQLALMS
jgi:hypothetical protein